jgi:hypothetical protein
MPTIDWPEALIPQSAQLTLRKAGAQFASPFNGTLQALDFIAERWTLSASLAQMASRNPRGVDAFCNLLAGGVERVRVWPFHTGGVPRGSLRGNVTVRVAAARGDTVLRVQGATSNAGGAPTLRAGDFLGCAGQLFQVAADFALAVGGTGDVPVINRVRGTIAVGAAVTWARPTCEMVMPAMQAGPVRRAGAIESTALDFVEVW